MPDLPDVSAYLIEETPGDKDRREVAAEAALEEARDRWRMALMTAGVPPSVAGKILAGLEAQGITPTVERGVGVCSGGMLYADPMNPNAVPHEALRLGQEWRPVIPPPDPPWVVCQDRDLDGHCHDPAHEHTVAGWLPFHRATPAESEALRARAGEPS